MISDEILQELLSAEELIDFDRILMKKVPGGIDFDKQDERLRTKLEELREKNKKQSNPDIIEELPPDVMRYLMNNR